MIAPSNRKRRPEANGLRVGRFGGMLGLAALLVPGGCVPSSQTPSHPESPVEFSESSVAALPDEISVEIPAKILDDANLDRQIDLAEKQIAAGLYNEASRILRDVLVLQPEHAAAKFDLAAVDVALGQLDDAISLLDSIPEDHPQFGIPARGRAADLCVNSKRYDDAIARYADLVLKLPSSSYAHRQLAALLNRQGRRHEAAKHLRKLCELGDVRQDELHALMVLSDAIYDESTGNAEHKRAREFTPIGDWGEARICFSKEQFLVAADLLDESVNGGDVPPSISALFGRCLAESQQDQRFLRWLNNVTDATREQAEYWAALGAWLLNQQRFDESVRALAEAVQRDWTDARSYRRIHLALTALNRHEDAQKWDDRHQLLRTVTLCSNQVGQQSSPDLELLNQIADGLEKLDRPLESVMWKSIGLYVRDGDQADLRRLNEQRLSLVKSGDAFPSESERIVNLDLKSFPKPTLLEHESGGLASAKTLSEVGEVETPVFRNIADEIGLSHTYRLASEPVAAGLTIYQVMGGGVAVVDFDLDGLCDLYFAQGGASPPTLAGELSNQLFRHVSERLDDVTESAGVTLKRYSTGVTSGDWNQDGFPDLVVGCLGVNELLINCGDGTFRAQATDPTDDLTLVTSSLGMGDLTGDHLPDIYEQTYVHDADYDVKPTTDEQGRIEIVAPSAYDPGMDRVLVNDGRGERDVMPISHDQSQRSTGLGLVLLNLDSADAFLGNQVYVGNDVRPNQLWSRTSQGDWTDRAPISGCSLGHDGSRTASMGIAAGDFDRNGEIDLHITNFENASARLYMNRGGAFQDRSITFNLADDSYQVLGFGTQAIDYNLDGWQDLVVTNGHVENTGIEGSPFEQPPQLFVNRGNRFELTTVQDESAYFSGVHVGRALARLDFNQDGKSDFVVTHLETPSALLINQTPTRNHWVQIQLVGTVCERDAIGARVELKSGNQSWTGWVTSGDGYLCRNEAVLSFGLGNVGRIDSAIVHWPNGQEQVFSDMKVDQRALLIQDNEAAYPLITNSR
ncbi:FG-GAP-like repeat-containing protein [Neorhodopirellula pilleata]|nr:FG-GAP-like repeat-containing protein [Neorhodopirellula pilleata]